MSDLLFGRKICIQLDYVEAIRKISEIFFMKFRTTVYFKPLNFLRYKIQKNIFLEKNEEKKIVQKLLHVKCLNYL